MMNNKIDKIGIKNYFSQSPNSTSAKFGLYQQNDFISLSPSDMDNSNMENGGIRGWNNQNSNQFFDDISTLQREGDTINQLDLKIELPVQTANDSRYHNNHNQLSTIKQKKSQNEIKQPPAFFNKKPHKPKQEKEGPHLAQKFGPEQEGLGGKQSFEEFQSKVAEQYLNGDFDVAAGNMKQQKSLDLPPNKVNYSNIIDELQQIKQFLQSPEPQSQQVTMELNKIVAPYIKFDQNLYLKNTSNKRTGRTKTLGAEPISNMTCLNNHYFFNQKTIQTFQQVPHVQRPQITCTQNFQFQFQKTNQTNQKSNQQNDLTAPLQIESMNNFEKNFIDCVAKNYDESTSFYPQEKYKIQSNHVDHLLQQQRQTLTMSNQNANNSSSNKENLNVMGDEKNIFEEMQKARETQNKSAISSPKNHNIQLPKIQEMKQNFFQHVEAQIELLMKNDQIQKRGAILPPHQHQGNFNQQILGRANEDIQKTMNQISAYNRARKDIFVLSDIKPQVDLKLTQNGKNIEKVLLPKDKALSFHLDDSKYFKFHSGKVREVYEQDIKSNQKKRYQSDINEIPFQVGGEEGFQLRASKRLKKLTSGGSGSNKENNSPTAKLDFSHYKNKPNFTQSDINLSTDHNFTNFQNKLMSSVSSSQTGVDKFEFRSFGYLNQAVSRSIIEEKSES